MTRAHDHRYLAWRNRLLVALGAILLVVVISIGNSLVSREVGDKLNVVANIRLLGEVNYVNLQEIDALLRPLLGQELISLDLKDVEGSLKGHEWINAAIVQRKWPDTLLVQVIEEAPVAQWQAGGFINAAGKIFNRESRLRLDNLVIFKGSEGTETEMLGLYKRLVASMRNLGLRFTRIERDAIGAYRVEINDGLEVVLGRRQISRRIKRLAHALHALNKLDIARLSRIDMRYGRGMAVTRVSGEQHNG
jgi:cell division protein FtsQ